MAAKHTPAPFTAEEGGKRGAWIKGADGHWLCLSCGDTDEEAAANTAFIVRAVNAHDDLVAALKEARAELEAYEQAATGENYNSLALNAALAKAEA